MYYLDIDSFKSRWIDKNSKKKNLPKLMDEIYYEENGSIENVELKQHLGLIT